MMTALLQSIQGLNEFANQIRMPLRDEASWLSHVDNLIESEGPVMVGTLYFYLVGFHVQTSC